MTHKSLARPTIVLLAAVAFAACHSKTPTTTATAPTPATNSPAANRAAARPSNGMPAGVTPAMIAMGDSIFHAKGCANCHGADAKGAKNGPDLTTSQHLQVNGSYADFVRIITDGVPAEAIKDKSHTVPMRARGGRPPLLTDDQIKAVAGYVYTLSHK